MTSETSQPRMTENAFSSVRLRAPAGRLRERILSAARAAWDENAVEVRLLRISSRNAALAVAAALVIAFVVNHLDTTWTRACRPQGSARPELASRTPAWVDESGLKTPLHRQAAVMAVRRARWEALRRQHALFDELMEIGG